MKSAVSKMRSGRYVCALIVLCFSTFSGFSRPGVTTPRHKEDNYNFSGRWRIQFKFSGLSEKHLIFDSRAKGVGSFSMLDTGVDNSPVPGSVPATWAELTNNRVSISTEVELPYGTCCREMGTLMLKGNLTSNQTMSGKALFITSTTEEENPIGFRFMTGSFTATKIIKNP